MSETQIYPDCTGHTMFHSDPHICATADCSGNRQRLKNEAFEQMREALLRSLSVVRVDARHDLGDDQLQLILLQGERALRAAEEAQ